MTHQEVAKYLLCLLENGGGTVAKAKVADGLPFLTEREIARIFAEHVPDVVETTVAGIPCWQRVQLPVNFVEHVKEATAKLEEMGFAISSDTLNLALSIRYGKNFRASYGLGDNAAFKEFLKKFLIGGNDKRRGAKSSDDEPRRAKDTNKGRALSQIIGLRGEPLPKGTWRNYLRIWRDPRRTEMARLNAKGTSNAEIARKFGLSEVYVSKWILWVHYNLPRILEKNGLTVEDISDV